jgi:hypothetical protein
MAAPTKPADVKETPCQPGAVHTWPRLCENEIGFGRNAEPRTIFCVFCSARGHKPQNSGCVYTALSFHTGWTRSGPRRLIGSLVGGYQERHHLEGSEGGLLGNCALVTRMMPR